MELARFPVVSQSYCTILCMFALRSSVELEHDALYRKNGRSGGGGALTARFRKKIEKVQSPETYRVISSSSTVKWKRKKMLRAIIFRAREIVCREREREERADPRLSAPRL